MYAYEERDRNRINFETGALGFTAFTLLNSPFALGVLRLSRPEEVTRLTEAFLYGSAIVPPVVTGAIMLKAAFNLRRLAREEAAANPVVLPVAP